MMAFLACSLITERTFRRGSPRVSDRRDARDATCSSMDRRTYLRKDVMNGRDPPMLRNGLEVCASFDPTIRMMEEKAPL